MVAVRQKNAVFSAFKNEKIFIYFFMKNFTKNGLTIDFCLSNMPNFALPSLFCGAEAKSGEGNVATSKYILHQDGVQCNIFTEISKIFFRGA